MTTLSRLRARAHEITLQYFELNRWVFNAGQKKPLHLGNNH